MALDAAKILAEHNPHFRTICEVLREINELGGPDIRRRCEEAVVMAKKMDAKLREYKGGYDEGWWEKK